MSTKPARAGTSCSTERTPAYARSQFIMNWVGAAESAAPL